MEEYISSQAKGVSVMAGNKQLHTAKTAKKDEFYTQFDDIANEMKHYTEHFRGATILCNCDDPYESNFFKYFALRFNRLGLKRLICTCYNGSPIANRELTLFDKVEEDEQGRAKVAYKIDITEVEDLTGDGTTGIEDIRLLLARHTPTVLKGNGDFRSEECVALLKQADIVVTNPPFSLFREYVAQLVEYEKRFIIIGNQNSIICKEIFPLIKENKLWMGPSISSGDRKFNVPDDYSLGAAGCGIDSDGRKFIRVKGVRWFTNLDHKKRHEPIDNLYKRYSPEEYPKYINYDAIEVGKTVDIPIDYYGVMGVPITFLDKYCPDQFEIIGITNGGELGIMCGVSSNLSETECKALFREDKSFRKGKVYYRNSNGKLIGCYARLLIRKKQ